MTVGKRRCGYRKPGKAYFVVDIDILGKSGLPINYFIQDPPILMDMSLISVQGITMLPRVAGYDMDLNPVFVKNAKGELVYDIYDYVGGDYPNVADFLEEAFTQGVSRLNPRTSDFAKVTKDSEYRLVHPKAVIVDPLPFYEARVSTEHKDCPKGISDHLNPSPEWLEMCPETCASLWWECIEDYDEERGGRMVARKKADGNLYVGAKPPVSPCETVAGIFMRFPVGLLGRWDVVKSEGDDHKEAMERLKALQDGLFRRTRLTEC